MPGKTIMRDTSFLGPWVRRFLMEHMVGEPKVAPNTQRSYRDTFQALVAQQSPAVPANPSIV